MKHRVFAILNLSGVFILATFCFFQWRRELLLEREVNALLQVKHAHETRIAAQERTISGLNDDLTIFKQQYSETRAFLAEAESRLHKAEVDNARLTANCEQLEANIEVWKEAVRERDEHLEEAQEILKDMAAQLNASIARYNELVLKHNELVAQENKTRQALSQAYKDLDDARRKLYRALGRPVPEKEKPANQADNQAAPTGTREKPKQQETRNQQQ